MSIHCTLVFRTRTYSLHLFLSLYSIVYYGDLVTNQPPPSTTTPTTPPTTFTHFTSSSSLHALRFPYTVFFGLQYIIKKWLCGPVLTKAMVEEAKEVINAVFHRDDVFNEDGWNYILEVCVCVCERNNKCNITD